MLFKNDVFNLSLSSAFSFAKANSSKIGNPEEIAKMVVFLLSDSSSWITRQIFGIDGGMSTIKL